MITNSTQSERLLSALSYFSVFFAPLIFPIVIWVLADKPVSIHAKKSLLYHILPYILIVIGSAILGYSGMVSSTAVSVILLLIGFIALIGAIYFIIYNLYCGIKILINDTL
ncbi:DUF4870 domain-containing protein [Staphylococcus equorum]|uniref:hypothetical protein n=1 Tax=Staphylococcus equorum TaxID=246432 RepID=UPI00397E9FF8